MTPLIRAAAARRQGSQAAPLELWTPAEMTTQLWLDASDESTRTIVTGVSQWADKSGNGYNFTQTTGSRQPTVQAEALNGLDVLRFDGSDDAMFNNSNGLRDLFRNQGYGTVFVTYRKNSTDVGATSRTLYVWNNGTDGSIRQSVYAGASAISNNLGLYARRLDGDGNSLLDYGAVVAEQWAVLQAEVIWSAGDGLLRNFGALIQSNTSYCTSGNTSNTRSLGPVTLGAYNNGTGANPLSTNNTDADIAECIALNAAPSTDDRQRIEGYLAHKWGLEAGLDGGHPYASDPPYL